MPNVRRQGDFKLQPRAIRRICLCGVRTGYCFNLKVDGLEELLPVWNRRVSTGEKDRAMDASIQRMDAGLADLDR